MSDLLVQVTAKTINAWKNGGMKDLAVHEGMLIVLSCQSFKLNVSCVERKCAKTSFGQHSKMTFSKMSCDAVRYCKIHSIKPRKYVGNDSSTITINFKSVPVNLVTL